MEGQLQQGVKHLIIDLSHVQYFSSAAIREVITVLKHSRERGGDLRLCAPSEKVLEVLNLAGLTPIFTIYEDQVGAVGSL
jgi:stage II sporulation protein AA (anti-sigma F factor antagonist)